MSKKKIKSEIGSLVSPIIIIEHIIILTRITIFFLDVVEYYDMETVFEKPSRRRASAICLFECNACLLGGTKTIKIPVRNVGRSSIFVCVPEQIWYTGLVEVSKHNVVILLSQLYKIYF